MNKENKIRHYQSLLFAPFHATGAKYCVSIVGLTLTVLPGLTKATTNKYATENYV